MAEAWESAPEVAAPAAAAPWESAPEVGAAPPSGDLRSLANAAADRHGIPQHLFRGLVSAESSWDPRAQPRDANGNLRSSAKGLTQLIDSTAAEVGVSDAFDPMQNLEGGARYLRALHDHFGDWDTAIAAYHDGPQKVMDAGITPDTGQPYLDRVRRHAALEEGRQPETPEPAPQPPDDLGRAIDASLAAHSATKGALSPDQGAEALDLAQQTGLGPTFVAGTLPAVKQAQERQALKATLAQAPITASFMAQSPAHAAVAKDDVDNLSFIEKVFGRYSPRSSNTIGGRIEEPGFAERALGSLPVFDTLFAINRDFDENFENTIPSVAASAYSKGFFALRAALLGLKAGLSDLGIGGPPLKNISSAALAYAKANGIDPRSFTESRPLAPLTENDKANLAQAQEFAATEIPGIKGQLGWEMFAASVEAVPQLPGFLGGTAAAAPFLLSQTYGQMFNQFSAQKNADGSRKYTDGQARDLSLGGAIATTTLLAGVGARFVKGTVGIAAKLLSKEAQDSIARTGVEALSKKLIESPHLFDKILGRGVQFQSSVMHGLSFMLGMGIANDLTDQAGEVMTGGKYDVSKSVQRALQSLDGAMMLMPMMATSPAIGLTRDVGRVWAARSNGLDVAAQIAAAKDSKLIKRAPEQAKTLLEAQAAQDPTRATAYIPVAAFDEAMRIAGLDPREAAKALLGDDGAAHQEAQATSGELAVPMPDLLARLAPQGHADALLPDIKLVQGPDGMTPREAQTAGPHIEAVLGDMRQALTAKEARELYGAIPADEQVGLKMPIAADLTPELAKQYERGTESDKKTTPGRGQNTPEKTAAFAVPKEMEARGAAAEAPEHPPDPDAKAIYDLERQKMLDAGRPEEEAQVFATLRAQNAVAMAKRYGGTPDEWHQRLGELRLVHGGEASAADLQQRGEIRAILGELPPGATMEDLRARLEADAQPENAGAAERFLSELSPDATMEDVRRWAEGGVPAGALFQATSAFDAPTPAEINAWNDALTKKRINKMTLEEATDWLVKRPSYPDRKYRAADLSDMTVDEARRELMDARFGGVSDAGRDWGDHGPPRGGRLFQRGQVDNPNLLVQHNLTAGNLLHADELGGIPAPSIAISKKESPLTNFGEITLLGDKGLIDPKTGTPVFNADVYSPRHPRASYNVVRAPYESLARQLDPLSQKLGYGRTNLGEEIHKRGPDAVHERQIRGALALLFLKEKGAFIPEKPRAVRIEDGEMFEGPALRDFFKDNGVHHNFEVGDEYHRKMSEAASAAIDQYVDKVSKAADWIAEDAADLRKTMREMYFSDKGLVYLGRTDVLMRGAGKVGQIEADPYALRDDVDHALNADPALKADFEKWAKEKIAPLIGEPFIEKYTEAGNRRRIAYTVENILREMTRKVRSAETFLGGLGHARSAGAKQFRSIEGIRAEQGKIVTDAEFATAKTDIDLRFGKLVNELRQYHSTAGERFSFGLLDALASAITESYKRTSRGIASELAKDQFTNVPPDLVDKVREFARDLVEMPTEYFEAKPQRLVHLSEFKAAVAPDTTPPEALETLKKHGIKVSTYKTTPISETGIREAAIREAAEKHGLLFQRQLAVTPGGGSFGLSAGKGNRGFITFETGAPGEPLRADLHFLQAADKSTAVHELSHFMLEAMGRISEQPDAPAGLKADYETALNEIGYGSHAERQVQRNERLDLGARADRTPEQEARLTELTGKEEAFSHLFETYLAKGTAPSKALAAVFARFKEWMRQIYGSIRGIAAQYKAAFGKDLKLSPAMRGVFDRLFAEDQVKQSQPEGLAAAGMRVKEARDFDAAFAAYAAKRIAELKIGEIKPWVYEQQAKIHAVRMMDLAKRLETARQGVVKTKVITPQNHAGEPATYKLVEAQDLITSHSPTGFGPEERYPKGVQERDYLGEQLEQAKVQIEAGRLNPALLLADTPTAVDGPPMVTSGDHAVVLGGNGRSMMLRRAYADGPAGAAYKEALRQKTDAFGIAPEAVDAMKEPVLVRSIDAIQSTAPRAEMAAAVRRFNEGLTQKLSPRLRAVAEARVLTPRTVASIGELLGKGDQSVRDLLRSEPQQFLRILERDGVVTDTTRPEWVTGGELTDEAKDRIEGMFLGRVMGSGERLQATAPSMQKKVERAVPALLRVESANPGLSEIGDVQGALDLINDAAHRGMPLEDVLDQRTMFVEGRVEPRTVAMARLFNETNGKEIGRLFKEWAEVAAHDTQGEAQGGMFEKARPPPTAENALARLFAGRKDDLSGSSRAADNAAPEAAAGAPGETTPTPVEKAADTVSAARIGPQALVRAVAGVLREVQEKHLVADHLARAADAARIEAGKIKEALKANAKDKRRELATKADFEMAEHGADPRPTPYTDGYDAIMESFGFRERSGVPLSADAAVARLEADDRLNFDPDVLKQSLRSSVLAKKPTLDVLTVDEAKTVKSAVTNILQAARAVIEVVRDEQRAQYADDARRIREHAGNRPPPPLPSPSDAGKSGGEGLGRILRAVDAGMLKPEVILRELGPVGEAYAKEMLKARNRADEIQAKVGARIQRAIDSMPAEMRRTRFDGVDGPPVGNGPDGRPLLDPGKWVRQDLMMLFAWAGTESSMARATKGLRITEGQLHQTFDQLTKAEKDFVQRAIWDVNDQVLKPLLLEQTMKSTGVPMETIEAKPITTKDGQYPGGFHHASYNREASKKAAARGAVGEIEGIGDYYGDLKNGWAVGAAKGFTKARAKGFSDIPNLNWSSYGSHVNAVIHYLAVDDFVKSFGGLLRRPDARAAIEASVGAEKLKQLDEGLKVMAQGTVAAPQSGFKIADNILGSLFRNRAAVSAFALNPKTLLMQLTHPLLAAPALRLGPGSLLYGLVHASAGPIASLGHFTAEHLVTGAGKAFDPLSWQAAREASAKWGDNELGFRWDRFTDKMREQFASVGPQGQPGPVLRLLTGGNTAAGETVRGGIAAARQGIDLMNYSMWHVMDGFLSQWIWHARDWKGRQAGEPAEVRAGRNDQAVRDAMPPMTISELSSYARDRGLVGSQLLVKRFPNTMYNLQEIATWQARTKMWESSPGLQRAIAVTGYAANAAATYMAMTFMARFLGQYISGHGRKKDEGETPGQWAIRQWLIGMFEPLPFGTEIATPIVEKLVNKKEITLDAVRRSFHAAPAIGVIEDEIADIGEAWNAHKPLNDRMFAGTRAIIRASSQRLPTQPLTQIQAAIDMARGKYRPKGAIDAAEKFTYGTPKPNQKRATNPFWSIEKRKF